MALHNLKIIVVDGGKADSGLNWGSDLNKSGERKKKPNDSLLYKVLNYNQTIRESIKKSVSPTAFFAVQAGINLATQTGRQFINYYLSDIGRKHGDSNYQAIVNRQIEVYTDVASLIGGAVNGAAAGSVFGFTGAAVGAVVGVASAGINLGFRQARRERAYQHEIFKDNNRVTYNLARTSYTGFTGRLR